MPVPIDCGSEIDGWRPGVQYPGGWCHLSRPARYRQNTAAGSGSGTSGTRTTAASNNDPKTRTPTVSRSCGVSSVLDNIACKYSIVVLDNGGDDGGTKVKCHY